MAKPSVICIHIKINCFPFDLLVVASLALRGGVVISPETVLRDEGSSKHFFNGWEFNTQAIRKSMKYSPKKD